MKKVLVTGGGGQLGLELGGLDEDSGCLFVCLGRDKLDITVPESICDALDEHKPDVIVNAAAYTRVDAAENEAEIAYGVNNTAAGYVARACADRSLPVIQLSTDYVFDGSVDVCDEETVPNPLNVYGTSKLAGERAVAQNNDRHIIVRTSWVFGRYGHNFMKTILRIASESSELRIVNDQQGSPTCTKHLADVLALIVCRICQVSFSSWGIYNYCDRPDVSWHEFAVAIVEQARASGLIENSPDVVPIATRDYPTPAKRPARSVLNCGRIRSVFGIDQADWRDGLQLALQEIN